MWGGPEGGGPDRCLGGPVWGKASDVFHNGAIVDWTFVCGIGVGGVVPRPREIGMGVLARRHHRPTSAA